MTRGVCLRVIQILVLGSTPAPSGAAQSAMEDDGENESAPNLDASMEDLDEDAAAETDEMNEGDTEDFEEEPSNII